MSIKDILAFPHIPTESQASAAVANASQVGTTPFRIYNNMSDARAMNYMTESDANGRWLKLQPGWAAGNGSVTGRSTGVSFPFALLYGNPTGVYYCGFRFKHIARVVDTFDWLPGSIIGLNSYNNLNTSNHTTLLTKADLTPLGWTAGNGREFYCEIRMDYTNAKATVWLDGTKIRDMTIASAASLISNGAAAILIGDKTGVNSVLSNYYDLYIRDMYWKQVNDAADDFPLGPQLIEDVPLDSATATGWVANGAADLKTALATPITTVASLATPTVTSDLGRNEAVLKFKPNSKPVPITAMILHESGQRIAGTSAGFGVKLKQGTTDGATVDVGLQNAMTYGIAAGVYDKDPTGAALTESNVTSLSVILTPKNV